MSREDERTPSEHPNITMPRDEAKHWRNAARSGLS
jgi:hypothetical protein